MPMVMSTTKNVLNIVYASLPDLCSGAGYHHRASRTNTKSFNILELCLDKFFGLTNDKIINSIYLRCRPAGILVSDYLFDDAETKIKETSKWM